MKEQFNTEEYVDAFSPIFSISDDNGFIVWRVGSGNNAELLHIRAYEKRKGTGTRLVKRMVEALKVNPPYHTVFGFTRISNLGAHDFYRKLGFTLSPVNGMYKDGMAMLFSQPFQDLIDRFSNG